MAEGQIQLASVICHEDCPLIGVSVKHLSSLFPDLPFNIMTIIRGDEKIVPDTGHEDMQIGDEVYFVTPSEFLQRVMAAFGHEEEEARHVLIAGGGNIGLLLARIIEEQHIGITVSLIENNLKRAQMASRQLEDTNVLHGDSLDRSLLEEAHIDRCEAVIAVTNHDETNVLLSLLAKEYGSQRSIALINNQAYMPLVSSLGVDAIVSPRAITVSIILEHIRKGRIKSAHSLRDGFAEVIELEALDTAPAVHVPIKELGLPKGVRVGMIIRDQEIIVPISSTIIKPQDSVIILAVHNQIKAVERIFSVHPEYF
jgi:trk system potassium uptake protein TrkA